MVWTPKFDSARLRAWLTRLACAALVFGVLGSALGERPKNEPGPRDSGRGLGLATIPSLAEMRVNRVILLFTDVGEIGSSGSSVAGGGFWKAESNQYIFSSGVNVGAKLADGTVVFANGGPFSELSPGSSRFPEFVNAAGQGLFWDSTDDADRASYPEVCSVDAPRIARFPLLESFAGEPFPGFADQTLCIAVNDYLGGACGECAGRRVGVTVVSTVFAFGVPTVQDFVFAQFRLYNDTKFINSTNSPLQPPGPYTLNELIFSFAGDFDIGEAGDDQITFLPDIGVMPFWDTDFSEPQFQGALGIGGVGLVLLPVDPATGEEIPLAEFTLFTNGAPRPDPPSKEVWYALQEGRSPGGANGSPPAGDAGAILTVPPNDVRGMVSTVKFSLAPDEFVEMGAAYFFAEVGRAPSGELLGEAYKNQVTGEIDPNANTDPIFGPLRAQAVVAQASANAGFFQALPPPSPDFVQIPGDRQITIVWDDDPVTASNPFGRVVLSPFNTREPVSTGIFLDPDQLVFFNGQFQTAGQAGIAGQEVTNADFNPAFAPFDFEGFRVYRSRTGLAEDAELIAQFDLANNIAGGEFCIAATPVFDSSGALITNVCTEVAVQAGPGGTGSGDRARFGSNTGLLFSVVDRGGAFPAPEVGPGLINGIPVAHAVTSFGVNCGLAPPELGTVPPGQDPPAGTIPTSACLTLESGKVFKLATPESDPSSFVPADVVFDPLQTDGTACDPSEPAYTVNAETGKFTSFVKCSNAIIATLAANRAVNIPTAEFFFVVDKITSACENPHGVPSIPPNCYELAPSDLPNTVHWHWEKADGSLATEIVPSSGTLDQHFHFGGAFEGRMGFSFDTDPTDVGNDLDIAMVINSDFSNMEDLEVNGRSVHLGELGGTHTAPGLACNPCEARPHGVSGSELADYVNLGAVRGLANAREYAHPSYYATGASVFELTWEVSGSTFNGTMRHLNGGQVVPKGGQALGAANPSTVADFIPGYNWCAVVGTVATVRPAVSPPRAGPCPPNNDVTPTIGGAMAIIMPGQSVYLEGLKQLPANGDVWTFYVESNFARGNPDPNSARRGREGGPVGNTATPPFSFRDVNSGGIAFARQIVNLFPGARFKLSLSGGSNELAAADLDAITVVPNPFIAVNEAMRGRGLQRILFTKLPPVATIRIYTINGNLIRRLEHTDGTGTEEFDVRTRFDLLLASGNYYYHVTTPDGRTHLGRFAVIN